ncbi:hypothetical protein AB0H88_37945 [Nonomuraea sp. NPDC050680]|uniref:hypothetical protein n=1 Tax=Nonomuraea sp. NPDC050680 TaxID=3154630 RepID=UPI0033FAE090
MLASAATPMAPPICWTEVNSLLADHAPARYRTEVFAWLNTFMWAGYGLGTAVAGQLTGPLDTGTTAFGAAAAAAIAGAILATVAARSAPPLPAQGQSRESDHVDDN